MRGWGSIAENIAVCDKAKAWGIWILGQLHLYRLRERSIVTFSTVLTREPALTMNLKLEELHGGE